MGYLEFSTLPKETDMQTAWGQGGTVSPPISGQ